MAAAVAGLALLLAGCDNSSNTPTSPSGGALQITAVRSVLRGGETQALTVTGSSGTPVTGVTWTSTDPSVLTMSATGVASAIRAGRVTVTAVSASGTGTIALRVVPDYAGTWTGGLARPQLTCPSGTTAPLCAPGAVTSGTVTLRIEQTGDQLTAVLTDSAEPATPVTLAGQVQADDQLVLAGRVETPVAAPTLRVQVDALRGSLDVALDALTGSYQWIVDRGAAGGSLQADYRAQVQFRDLRR